MSDDLAAHVALALRRHLAALEKYEIDPPTGLRELHDLMVAAARGRTRTHTDTAAVVDLLRAHDERMATTKEAAAILRCSERTVRRRIQSGEIEARKVGRSYLIPPVTLHELTRRASA